MACTGSTVFTVPLCDTLFMSRTTETSLTVSAFFEVLNLICVSTADCLLWLHSGSVLILLRTTRISKRSHTTEPALSLQDAQQKQVLARPYICFLSNVSRCIARRAVLRHDLTTSSGQSIKCRDLEGTFSCTLLRNNSDDKPCCLRWCTLPRDATANATLSAAVLHAFYAKSSNVSSETLHISQLLLQLSVVVVLNHLRSVFRLVFPHTFYLTAIYLHSSVLR
jgi:hypothetical protein